MSKIIDKKGNPVPQSIFSPVVAANPLLSVLWHHKGKIFIAALICSSAITNVFQHLTIQKLQAQNESLSMNADFYLSELEKCSNNEDKRNRQIKELSEKTAESAQKMKDLEKILSDIKRNTGNVVDSINNAPTPTTCQEAMDFIRNNINAFD